MKVAQVCTLFPYYGGDEIHVREISKRLSERGVEVRIYSTDPFKVLPEKNRFAEIEILGLNRSLRITSISLRLNSIFL